VPCQALEKALLSFHTTKMADINKTVRELWQKTYRGQVRGAPAHVCYTHPGPESHMHVSKHTLARTHVSTHIRMHACTHARRTSTTLKLSRTRTARAPTTTGDAALCAWEGG